MLLSYKYACIVKVKISLNDARYRDGFSGDNNRDGIIVFLPYNDLK
jgi:hypothetical protein